MNKSGFIHTLPIGRLTASNRRLTCAPRRLAPIKRRLPTEALGHHRATLVSSSIFLQFLFLPPPPLFRSSLK
jgi:hypothetical protein